MACFMVIASSTVFGQAKQLKFKTIHHRPYSREVKKVNYQNEKIDIHYFNKHLHFLTILPINLVSVENANDTIETTHGDLSDKRSSWTNTYIYDSKSRMTYYSYSGCLACSRSVYAYRILYDEKGRVLRFRDVLYYRNEFKMTYDRSGNLVKIGCYNSGKLSKVMKLK